MDKQTRELIDRLAERWNKEIVQKRCGFDFEEAHAPWDWTAFSWVLGAGLTVELALLEEEGFLATCAKKNYMWKDPHAEKNSRKASRHSRTNKRFAFSRF